MSGNFIKGGKRSPTAGRRKGTPNKSTVAMRTRVAELDFDIAAAAIDLFKPSPDESTKIKMLELIAKYTQVVPTSNAPESAPLVLLTADEMSDEELIESLS